MTNLSSTSCKRSWLFCSFFISSVSVDFKFFSNKDVSRVAIFYPANSRLLLHHQSSSFHFSPDLFSVLSKWKVSNHFYASVSSLRFVLVYCVSETHRWSSLGKFKLETFTLFDDKMFYLHQEDHKDLLWALFDNGFWVIFLVTQSSYEFFKVMTGESSGMNELNSVILIFHCFVVIILSFIFVCIKSAYNEMKTNQPKDKRTIFHPDYYEGIERSRCNLNDGYEIPTSSGNKESQKSSIYEPYDDLEDNRVYEQPSFATTSNGKRTVYAEIYTEPKVVTIYDEIKKQPSDEYDKLQVLR